MRLYGFRYISRTKVRKNNSNIEVSIHGPSVKSSKIASLIPFNLFETVTILHWISARRSLLSWVKFALNFFRKIQNIKFRWFLIFLSDSRHTDISKISVTLLQVSTNAAP